MRRLIVSAALVALLTTTATAAQIRELRVGSGVQLGRGSTPAPPLTIRWELQHMTDPTAPAFGFEVTATPGIVDSAPEIWTIDETNAADYGLDWAAAKTASEGLDYRKTQMYLNGAAWSGRTIEGHTLAGWPFESQLLSFSLSKVEIEVQRYIWLAPGNNANDLIVRHRTYGMGQAIPEPSAAWLATLGLAGLGRRRPA